MPQDNGFEEMTVTTVLIVLIAIIIRKMVRGECLKDELTDTSLCRFLNFQAIYIQQSEQINWFINWIGQELS